MHISWEYLETFLAVSEESSFSAAAKRLGVTQPTVSRRISALERQLGRTLFERDAEGARVTESGAKLLLPATQMARQAEELFRVAEDFEEKVSGTTRLAAPPLWTELFVVPFARHLSQQLPDIALQLESETTEAEVALGRPHLALTDRCPSHDGIRVLMRARCAQGLHIDSRSTQHAPLDWDEISLIAPPHSDRVGPSLAPSKRGAPSRALLASDPHVQLSALRAGMGALVLPELFFGEAPFQKVSFSPKYPPVDVYLLCAESYFWMPRVRAVAHALCEALRLSPGIEIMDPDARA